MNEINQQQYITAPTQEQIRESRDFLNFYGSDEEAREWGKHHSFHAVEDVDMRHSEVEPR
jgi:hypothetical protein